MPTARWEPTKSKTKPWRVRWRDAPGQSLKSARFANQDEAVAFAETRPVWRGPQRFGDLKTWIRSSVLVDDQLRCWHWQRGLSADGYAQMSFPRNGHTETVSAPRVAYEAFVGVIPEGLHIDHLCRLTACVNPDHLEPVTPSENKRRSWASLKAIRSTT